MKVLPNVTWAFLTSDRLSFMCVVHIAAGAASSPAVRTPHARLVPAVPSVWGELPSGCTQRVLTARTRPAALGARAARGATHAAARGPLRARVRRMSGQTTADTAAIPNASTECVVRWLECCCTCSACGTAPRGVALSAGGRGGGTREGLHDRHSCGEGGRIRRRASPSQIRCFSCRREQCRFKLTWDNDTFAILVLYIYIRMHFRKHYRNDYAIDHLLNLHSSLNWLFCISFCIWASVFHSVLV